MASPTKTAEKRREQQIKWHMSSCVHFTGIQNKTCKADVNIRELVGGPDFGWARKIPCLLRDADECTVVCPSRQFPTREEAEALEDEHEKTIARFTIAVAAAHADAKAKGFKVGLGGADSLPCPLECGGRLYYRVASVNGHMHAKCETPNCVSWME